MGVVNFYIKHKKADSSVYTTFYDFKSIQLQRAMEAKTNNINIIFPNKWGEYSGVQSSLDFREDDTIEIYGSHDIIDEDNDLIINGLVKQYNQNMDSKTRNITLISTDRTYDLLSTIYQPGKFDYGDGYTAPTAIKKIIDWVSSNRSDDRTGSVTYTNVQTTPTKKTGDPSGTAAFTTIQAAELHKTAYEWILTLSQEPHTNYTIDGSGNYKSARAYKFWIDKDMDFHWEYPSDDYDASITIGNSAHKITGVNLIKTVFDVVNLVIFDCGNDNSGVAIKWYYYDVTSDVPELRAKFEPMTDIAKEIRTREKRIMDENSITYDDSGYPDNYSNYNAVGNLPTWDTTETPSSDDDYDGSITGQTGFRWACVKRGLAKAAAITRRTGSLRWKGSLEMIGNTDYNPGDLLNVTYSDYNMENVLLRVKSVTDDLSKRGWFTTIDLEEDEKEVYD